MKQKKIFLNAILRKLQILFLWVYKSFTNISIFIGCCVVPKKREKKCQLNSFFNDMFRGVQIVSNKWKLIMNWLNEAMRRNILTLKHKHKYTWFFSIELYAMISIEINVASEQVKSFSNWICLWECVFFFFLRRTVEANGKYVSVKWQIYFHFTVSLNIVSYRRTNYSIWLQSLCVVLFL